MDVDYIKSIRRVIRSRVKSVTESVSRANQNVNNHFGGEHTALRLQGEDRVYHTGLTDPGIAYDYLKENAEVEPTGHGAHPGGHIHFGFPEGSYGGTHHEQYGERPPAGGLSVSHFRHLGREIVEHHSDHPNKRAIHIIRWTALHPVHKDSITHIVGQGKTEREARSHANNQYHQWHQEWLEDIDV